MAGYRRSRRSRRGFTLVEALVGLAVLVVLGLVAIPVVYRVMERFRSKACESNLHKIGAALQTYRSTFQDRFPIGSQYQRSPESPYGKTWWLDVLRYTDYEQVDKNWSNGIASSGDFNGKTANQNIKLVDGLRPDIMFCPSSSLPHGSKPSTAISKATRDLLGHEAQGIPVPMYVAVSGSAPDMKGAGLGTSISGPQGRNTKDGKYGILSGSGVFPPNQQISAALVRDGTSHTIAVAEQSAGWEDERYDPPLPFDFRSAWPAGAFTGSGGNYQQLRPTADGIDGSGDKRCLNCTSVRYAVNTKGFQKGIMALPAAPVPPPKEGEPPPPPAPKVLGPGHNQGIFSCHGGGAWVLFADGSVHWLNESISLMEVLLPLCTRDDERQTEGY
jgi:prepilin-type N-terminal cleavage/methylation domain-containing protein/prepilin-type processing-associated H-X9-DG protein